MRIIRAGEGRRVPWKNGGGWTTEIAVHPDGAGLDDFVWRLSTAPVVADGPFSLFPGVDRSLAILDGEGLRLAVGGRDRVVEDANPVAFPGDVPTSATLLRGPVIDLNVMTRRIRARHHMRRLVVTALLHLDAAADTTLVYCAGGRLTIGGTAVLTVGDCAASRRLSLGLDGDGDAIVIAITMQ